VLLLASTIPLGTETRLCRCTLHLVSTQPVGTEAVKQTKTFYQLLNHSAIAYKIKTKQLRSAHMKKNFTCRTSLGVTCYTQYFDSRVKLEWQIV